MCKIDPSLFDELNGDAPLFAGQQQHWVIAFPDSGISDEMRVMFFRNRYLGDLPVSELVVTGSQVGKPEAIRGRLVRRVGQSIDISPSDWLPSDTRYLSIAFDLEGSPKGIPWLWDHDGCPEELTMAGGLYAVYQPAPIFNPPKPDPIGETVDDIKEDIEDVADEAGELATKAAIPVGLGLAGGLGLWLLLRK